MEEEKCLPLLQGLSRSPSLEGGEESWLGQVKGRLAKTVDTGLEKFQERREREVREEQERERLRASWVPPEQEAGEQEVLARRMSHSFSEAAIQDTSVLVSGGDL